MVISPAAFPAIHVQIHFAFSIYSLISPQLSPYRKPDV